MSSQDSEGGHKQNLVVRYTCSSMDIENLHLGMNSDYEGSYPLVKLELARGIGLSGSDESSKTARPVEYYRKFLEQDLRPDGRSLEEFRPTLINLSTVKCVLSDHLLDHQKVVSENGRLVHVLFLAYPSPKIAQECVSTADGSAIVKVGNTTVMCGIKAEIATPKAEEPKSGYIVPNVELSPLCSPMFKPGPPSEQAQDASQFVADVMKHSGCIDTVELCIVPGKFVWVLYCDMVCLDYDGNVGDASVLALLAALKNTCLPKVSWDEEEERLKVKTGEKCQVTVHSNPVSSTFIIFDNEILLVDPTVEEESLSTGEISVVTTEDHLCVVRKPGGCSITADKLLMCVDQAFHRNRQVVQLLRDTLESIDR